MSGYAHPVSAGATGEERRTFAALEDALDDLQQATLGNDPGLQWRRTLEVLNLLHSLDDQADKRLGSQYRNHLRRRTDDGKILAGLTLARGIVHHYGADVKAIKWAPGEVHVQVNGRWAKASTHVRTPAGGWAKTHPHVAVGAIWRPLAELPPSPEKQLHDRDTYYDELVKGRRLMDPLRAAQRYLGTLQQP